MLYSRGYLILPSRVRQGYSTTRICSFSASFSPSRSFDPSKKTTSKQVKTKISQKKPPLAWKNIIIPSKSIVASESDVKVSLSPPSAPIMKNILKNFEEVHNRNLISEEKLLRFVESHSKSFEKDSQESQTKYAEDGAFEELQNENQLNKYSVNLSEVESLVVNSSGSKMSENLLAKKNSIKVFPGDLIIKQDQTGIVLREDNSMYTCLFSNGSILLSNQDSFSFHVPAFLDSDFVTEVVKFSKTGEIIAEFKKSCDIEKFLPLAINILSSLESKAASFVMLNHRDLSNFIKKFDGGDFQSHNIFEVFKKFRNSPGVSHEHLGFFNFFIKQTELFFPDRDHMNHFVCYPKDIVNLSKELNAQVRANHKSLDLFINKAAKLIKLRQSKYNIDYIKNIFPEESPAFIPQLPKIASKSEFQSLDRLDSLPSFNQDDLKYIQGIWQFILSEKMALSSSFAPLACAIIKPLGYSYVNAPNALQFLKDIGAAKVCENLNLHHYSIKLVDHPESSEKIPLALEDFNDPYSSIRHDFEDIPVFTIDDLDAKEIDDGISIETSGEGSSNTWLHIHIADPTTLIQPNSDIDNHCRKQPLTVYTPEMTWPMLPKSISHGICSLDSSNPGPRFVLTFSALLDQTGNIVDYRIKPGKINNIVSLSYDEVNDLLGIKDIIPLKDSHPKAKDVSSFETNPVKATYIESLKKLHSLVHKHFLKRKANGAIDLLSHSVIIKSDSLSPFKSPIEGKSFPDYTGFDKPPTVSYKLVKNNPYSSQNLIAESMVIAGHLAALYCKQNNLALPFIAQASPDSDHLPVINKMINSNSDEQTDLLNFLVIRHYFKQAEIHLAPCSHYSMGLKEGYLRVTSPLRRYTDMIAHWQIKNHLLNSSDSPVFSEESIISLMNEIAHPFQDIRNLGLRSDRFWLLSLLQRFEYEVAKSPVYFQSQNASVISRIHYPKSLHPEKPRGETAKPVYRGRLVRYEPTIKSWIAMILPFEKSVIFRGNRDHCKHSGVSPDELDSRFKPGQEVEMIINSLLPDYNKVLFVDPIN